MPLLTIMMSRVTLNLQSHSSFPEEVSTLSMTIEGLVVPWKDRLGTKLKCLEETLDVLQ